MAKLISCVLNEQKVKAKKLLSVLDHLEKEFHSNNFLRPMSFQVVAHFGRDPFLILISCLLGLRCRDSVVFPLCKKIFSSFNTPESFVLLERNILEQMIKSTGSFRKKAHVVHAVCKDIIEKHNGNVPYEREMLMNLYGVGHKTAALVRAEGFNISAICVDTHVMRVCRMMNLIDDKTSSETLEKILMEICPENRWNDVNRLLVMYGQNLCSPWRKDCKKCPKPDLCVFIREPF